MTQTQHIERNRENVYLTEAWDLFDGSRFLGTAVFAVDGTGWQIVVRGSFTKSTTIFPTRVAAFDAIRDIVTF